MKKVSEEVQDNISTPPETLSHAARLQLVRDKFLAARNKRKEKLQAIRANRKTTVRTGRRSSTPRSGRRCCGRR